MFKILNCYYRDKKYTEILINSHNIINYLLKQTDGKQWKPDHVIKLRRLNQLIEQLGN